MIDVAKVGWVSWVHAHTTGKMDVISKLMTEGGHAPDETHFFEDRWPTLAKCLKDKRLDGVNLYLCSWGYCTEGELELGRANPRITVLDLDAFTRVVTGYAVPV